MRRGRPFQTGPAWEAPVGGRFSRMVEPVVLYLLASGTATHGYNLVEQANQLGLAETVIDPGTVYRCLRSLEADGCVVSVWDTTGTGPARRVYELTQVGRQRLAGWVTVINQRAKAMSVFVDRCRSLGIDEA